MSGNEIFQWMLSPENDKVLKIMRGVPSTGKSYRAKELSGNNPSVIFSADNFFGSTPEEYKANWSVEKLMTAHNWCKKNVRMAMQRQQKLVIVDNTNTQIREMMPYFDMAVQYQYRVEVEEPTSPWWVNDIEPYLLNKELNRKHLEKQCVLLCEKNQESHGVPLESMKKMLFRYQPRVTFNDLAKVFLKNVPTTA